MSINKNSVLLNIYLIAQQEVKASFASKRGVFIASVYSVLWVLLLVYPIQFAADSLHNPNTSSLSSAILSFMGLESLKAWLFSELAMYWVVALILFPFFSLLMSVDQMISERNRGGLRFLVLRCQRKSIFLGRFIGQLIIQSIFILITLFIVYVFIINNHVDGWQAIISLPFIFVNLILVTVPFIALMSIFSVIMSSIKMAYLMVIVALALSLFIVYWLADYVFVLEWLVYFIPGVQVFEMMDKNPDVALLSLGVPLLQGIGLLLVGYGLFKRQAL